jgi:hypothetical protein
VRSQQGFAAGTIQQLVADNTPVLPKVRMRKMQDEILDGSRDTSGTSDSDTSRRQTRAAKTPPCVPPSTRANSRSGEPTPPIVSPKDRTPIEAGTLAGKLGWGDEGEGGEGKTSPRRARKTPLDTKPTPVKDTKTSTRKKEKTAGPDDMFDKAQQVASETAQHERKVGLADLTPLAIEQLRATLQSEETGSVAILKEVVLL